METGNGSVTDSVHADDSNSSTVPLAALFCIAILAYALLVLFCVLVRQLAVGRRCPATVDSSGCDQCCPLRADSGGCWCCPLCADSGCCCGNQCCLQPIWPRPVCRLPCRAGDKTDQPSFLHRLAMRCNGPLVACAGCPSTVHCCGLEIRRAPGSRQDDPPPLDDPHTSNTVIDMPSNLLEGPRSPTLLSVPDIVTE